MSTWDDEYDPSTCANRGCPSCTTPPPPGQTYSSWAVLLRVCRQLDDRHNFGAGPMRKDDD